MQNDSQSPFANASRKIEKLQEIRTLYHDIKDQYEQTSFDLEESRIENVGTEQLEQEKKELDAELRQIRGEYRTALRDASAELRDLMSSLPDHVKPKLNEHLERLKEWDEDLRESMLNESMRGGTSMVEPRVPEAAPTSRIPTSNIPGPSRLTKIPQLPTKLRAPAASRIPGHSELPGLSRIQNPIKSTRPPTLSKRPESVRAPAQSRLPEPSRAPPSRHLPVPSQKPPVRDLQATAKSRLERPPSRLPGLSQLPQRQKPTQAINTASQIQLDIQRHKEKVKQGEAIKKRGSLANIRRAEELKLTPRIVPASEVRERNEALKSFIESSKTLGLMKKRASLPLPQSSFVTDAYERTREVGLLGIQHASSVQKKMLNQQRKIGDEQVAKQHSIVSSDYSAEHLLLMGLDISETLTDHERNLRDKQKTEETKKNFIRKLTKNYKKFLNDVENLDDSSREITKKKFLDLVAQEMKSLFNMIRLFRSFFRGASYKEDAVANNLFTQNILDFFANEPESPACDAKLARIFDRMPDPKIKTQKSFRESLDNSALIAAPVTPMSSLKKRPSNPLLRQTLIRSFARAISPSTPRQEASEAVAEQVRKLQLFKEREKTSRAAIRQKFNNFLSNFCQILSRNHNKTRHSSFEVWSVPFIDNIEDILDDLGEFYQSLPHTEGKNFDHEKIRSQFQTFLYELYKSTKNRKLGAGECKTIVGERIEASAEIGRLKHLERSLQVFISQVQELLDPLVLENEKRNVSQQTPQRRSLSRESLLRAPAKFGIPRSARKSMDTPARPSTAPSTARKSTRFELPSKMKPPSKTPSRGLAKPRPVSTPSTGLRRPQAASTPYPTSRLDESQKISRRSIRSITQDALKEADVESDVREVEVAIHQGLLKIILLSKKIKQEFCQVLSNPDDLHYRQLEDNVYVPVRELKDLFENVLYGGNDEIYPQEMQELDDDFVGLGIHPLTRKFRDQKVEIGDCSEILRGKLDTSTLPDDDIRRDLASFWKKFENFQSKYIMKIINRKELGETTQPVDGILSTSSRKSPKMVASKLKTTIRPSGRKQVVKPKPTIQPFQYIQGLEIPIDVIERDILYVACQLTERDEENFPLPTDRLIRSIIQIAKNFKNSIFTKRNALQTISVLFWSQPCVSIDFLNVFIYHPNNEFFEEIAFNEPHTESAIRSTNLENRNLFKCATDKSFGSRQHMTMIHGFSDFMEIFDDDIDDLARSVMLAASGKYKSKLSKKKLMGDVTVCGSEKLNADNELLAVPTKINGAMGIKARAGLAAGMPDANFANESILEGMILHDGRLMQQTNNANYLEGSKIYRQGLKHVLHPTALNRQNFWQARGGNLPSWFPGFFTVFKDSNNLNPVAQFAPEAVFLHAWRTMAPLPEAAA